MFSWRIRMNGMKKGSNPSSFGHIAATVLMLLYFCFAGLTVNAEDFNGWTLQFSDDFNRKQIGDDWSVLKGKWSIKDGMLTADDSGEAEIICMWKFQGGQRLEFDAVTEDKPCDLSAFLSGSRAHGFENSYFFGFGSNNNTCSKLLVNGKCVEKYDARIVPGKRHHIICQNEEGRLTHTIDGKTVMTYEDGKPLKGPGHEMMGFYIHKNKGKIDNVRIYTKGGGASKVSAKDPVSRPAATGQEVPKTGLSDLVPDPLFEELFGDTPAPESFLCFAKQYDRRYYTPYSNLAKRAGIRYIMDEQLGEAAKHKFICASYSKSDEAGFKKHGIPIMPHNLTNRHRPQGIISLSDGSLPCVFGLNTVRPYGWIFDPRFLNAFVYEIEERARENKYWGILQLDELWTFYALKPVPRDKWYKQVFEAEKEVKEKYGFGKYGIPETHNSGTPFERIAYCRWASDKLTETFKKAYKGVKAINPDIKVIAPTHGSGCTSADIEAWAPYFDILGGQCGCGHSSSLIDKFRIGFITKIYVDLTGKPIWMMVHTAVKHAPFRQPEDIREMYSQVFRSGGQNVWVMGIEFFEKSFPFSVFAEPEKWRAMLNLTKTISEMRLPKLPKPDCAILYSSDSLNTSKWGGLYFECARSRIGGTYTVLGPLLRSWFHIVSDRQIDCGTRNLNDYKVLYIPFAEYQRASVLDKIKSYVKSGGTVVCTDTNAFTWNINGESLAKEWEKVSGVRKTGQNGTGQAVMRTVASKQLPLPKPISVPALVSGTHIVPVDNKVVNIAVFKDGSPAITVHPYGKGKVIFFAADPFYDTGRNANNKKSLVAVNAPVVKLMEAIQKSVGAQMGRDIWRFKLPPFKSDMYQKETGLCLTGNYVYDVDAPLLEPNNLDTKGTYVYSRLPTGISDDAKKVDEAVSFKQGHLTNRLGAYKTRKKTRITKADYKTDKWIVSWTDTTPVSITFDLKKLYPLKKTRIFYSGTMPALKVKGSCDGNSWQDIASNAEETVGLGVKNVDLPLNGKYRYVKFDFAARKRGKAFELCELEIWSKKIK